MERAGAKNRGGGGTASVSRRFCSHASQVYVNRPSNLATNVQRKFSLIISCARKLTAVYVGSMSLHIRLPHN